MVQFGRGRAVRVGRQPDGASRGQNVVLRARSRLGERRYDVVRNNCEHFCNWCQFGEHQSSQIDLLPRPVRKLLEVLQRVGTSAVFASRLTSRI
jgi:HRAS-like suppressor 3